MKLKKLTIFGFKSFADKVILDFDCSIIGIVGPNGCGKSNIVDAFRWVTGEQSAKSLRGDKMHDILFAGTDQRKPLNYAEVSVTLSEVNDELPLPYEEITISRRLHRSGESEYFINKELVQLKDLRTLFLGSGIGKNAFSIFEQGKLDHIIHLSPLDRRGIFDEAAGTSRFLLRKKESLRKLALVNENFARVKDVHAEIEKQTKQLKKQASHAKTYQEHARRLEDLEKSVLLYRLRTVSQKNTAFNERLQSLQQAAQVAQAEIISLEGSLGNFKQELSASEIAAKQQQKELNLCETKVRVQESEINQLKQRVLEIKKREENLNVHLRALSREQSDNTIFIQQKEEELSTLTRISHNTDLKDLIKLKRAEHLKKLQEEGRCTSELQEKTFGYESKLARLQTLNQFEVTHKNLLNKTEEIIAEQQKKVLTLTQHVDSFKEEIDQLEKELFRVRKQQSEAQKEEQLLSRQITETEGHIKSLNRLKENMEGFSLGAKALLKEAKSEKSPLYQKIKPLFEYVLPLKGYEELLATSMKSYSDTLVVESESDFEQLLDFAKKKKISDFSIIVKKRIKAKKERTTGTLAECVESNALAYHLTGAFAIAEEGHFYDSLGVFFHVGSGKKLNNTFYLNAELKSLMEALATLQSQELSTLQVREQIAEKLKTSEKRRNELFEIRRKKEMDLVKENFILQRALADLENLELEIVNLKKEKEALSHLEIEEKHLIELRDRLKTVKSEAHSLLATLQQEEALLEKWQEAHQQILIVQAKQQQLALHEKKMLEEIEDLKSRVASSLAAISCNEEEIERSNGLLATLQVELQAKEKKVLEAKKDCESFEKELIQKRKNHAHFEKEVHAVEIVLAQDVSERRSIEGELKERHGLTDLDAEVLLGHESAPLINLEEVTKEIQYLRHALETAGAVNMTAIGEFKETQARFDYLDQQLKDLEESKKDLEEIIAKLDQESRKTFKKTFQLIRENFQKNFSILFNGGNADLTFTENSDILEAGIEIVAKPPGKQMRSISLLSGGEKCLTALALLFSIFEVKPAPFCILDEVDAPLDDTNIDRFTHVLKQFIDKTQFIIVTHNKKTMAIADLLIGVSMEEKGISKLISLNLEKKQSVAVL